MSGAVLLLTGVASHGGRKMPLARLTSARRCLEMVARYTAATAHVA